MPSLNGSRVRHRIAELDWDLAAVSSRTGIPEGTLKNATRDRDPQPLRLRRVYRLHEALNPPGREPIALNELLADSGDDPQTDPPDQTKVPKPPARRTEKAGKAPKRITNVRAAS